MLGPEQVKEIERQKEEISLKARGLFSIPPGIAALLEKNTGITADMVRGKVEELLAW